MTKLGGKKSEFESRYLMFRMNQGVLCLPQINIGATTSRPVTGSKTVHLESDHWPTGLEWSNRLSRLNNQLMRKFFNAGYS